jgi:hypothetical protein
MRNHQFHNREVLAMLEHAGWYIGRNIAATLTLPDDTKYPSSAIKILEEFGELSVRSSGSGISVCRNSIRFHPMDAEGENKPDGRIYSCGKMIGQPLYPLGFIPNDAFYLCVDGSGKMYLVGDKLYLIGETFVTGVCNILLGVRGKVFHETELRWMF